jgi:hypothetical protein
MSGASMLQKQTEHQQKNYHGGAGHSVHLRLCQMSSLCQTYADVSNLFQAPVYTKIMHTRRKSQAMVLVYRFYGNMSNSVDYHDDGNNNSVTTKLQRFLLRSAYSMKKSGLELALK